MQKSEKTSIYDLSIVVLSFDGYMDVWPYFFEAYKKFWADCYYPIYLVNNEAKVEFENVTVINTGKEIDWCDRARNAIKMIDTKYIVLLLDDYLIGEKVGNADIDQTMEFMVNNNVEYLRLINIPRYRGKEVYSNGFYNIYKNEEYGINLQASIWEKDFLLQGLNNSSGSAWEFEINYLRQAIASKCEPFSKCYVNTHNILDIHNGILKGKWFPNTIRYFQKIGINIDHNERGKLSFREVSSYSIRVFLKERIPYWLRKIIKRFLKRLGVKFISEY